MAAKTDQERAEFEAQFKHLDLTQEPDAWGAPRYKHDAISLAWEAWQASRRVQVVPMTLEQAQQSMRSATSHKPGKIIAASGLCAPQPPEAAPVQMPEPISKALEDCRSCVIDYATCQSPYNRTRLDTAFQRLDQVRQLLAQHGIK